MAKNIEMNYYNGSSYETVYPKTLASLVLMSNETAIETKIENIDSNIESINTEITSLKTSVSEGKALIASAVTDKGVTTASDATFATIASNINSIAKGIEWEMIQFYNTTASTVSFTLSRVTHVLGVGSTTTNSPQERIVGFLYLSS